MDEREHNVEERDKEFYLKYMEIVEKHKKLGTLKGLSKKFLVEETISKTFPEKWHISYQVALNAVNRMIKNGTGN